jgi:3-methyl-2-oxobutanoate hydroxymethyltransferase
MMTGEPPAGDAARSQKRLLSDVIGMRARGERIAMVTVYDAPSARLADRAGIDLLLVGDSAAMTVLGYEGTTPVTLDEMLMLTRAVARTSPRAPVVADMPFGSFQVSDESAVAHAVRFVKEAGADAVKLEGAGPSLRRVGAILDAGIPVMGHIGLTPQSATKLGGYKPQGLSANAASRLIDAARSLERAGCFAVVLEAIPAAVAARITEALAIPTIGIGAGPSCSGQVLVWHDLVGLSDGHLPKFVKQYANLSGDILAALRAYVQEVRTGRFPEAQHTYRMPDAERERFEAAAAAAKEDPSS